MDPVPDRSAPPTDPPSLADRLAGAMRGDRRGARRDDAIVADAPLPPNPDGSPWFGVLLAVLLPAGPVLAWAAATIQTQAIVADTQAYRRAVAPALAARTGAFADRAALAAAAPGIADTVNAFARILPSDTRLAAVAADEQGRLSADAATPDPDTLRTALRRDPRTAMLRDVGQTRGDGIIVVRLREQPR